jgi:hypothetical protein
MVVAHCLAPVGQCEIRVDLLRFDKRKPRLIELEAVQRLYTGEERILRFGSAGIRKADIAELRLLGLCRRYVEYQQDGCE